MWNEKPNTPRAIDSSAWQDSPVMTKPLITIHGNSVVITQMCLTYSIYTWPMLIYDITFDLRWNIITTFIWPSINVQFRYRNQSMRLA